MCERYLRTNAPGLPCIHRSTCEVPNQARDLGVFLCPQLEPTRGPGPNDQQTAASVFWTILTATTFERTPEPAACLHKGLSVQQRQVELHVLPSL